MTKVTVNKPEQVQVQVSSDKLKTAFTSTEPELRVSTANNSLTNIILEGNTSVDVQGSLASIANYFESLGADFNAEIDPELLEDLEIDPDGFVEGDVFIKYGSESILSTAAGPQRGGRRGRVIKDAISFTKYHGTGADWGIKIAKEGHRAGFVVINTEGDKFDINGADTTIKLENLIDFPSVSSAEAGKVLTVNPGGDGYLFETPASGGGGATTFSELTDTPSVLNPNQFLKANSTGTSLEFEDINIPTKLSDLTIDYNNTDLAVKSYVDAQVTGLLDGAPLALDTLKELADALNNESDFAANITNQLSAKVNTSQLDEVAFTGNYNDLEQAPDAQFYLDKRNEIVDKIYIDTLNVDADTLDGRDVSSLFIKNDPLFPALLGDLSDVDTSEKTDGQVLVYNAETDIFRPGSALESLNLGGINNVDVNVDTSPENYVLKSTGNMVNGRTVWERGLLNFSELQNTPTTISGYGITDAFDGDYDSLSNKPSLFDGNYDSLSNRPQNLTDFNNNANYQSDTEVDAAIDAKVNNSFINNLTIDADTLNGFNTTNLYQNLSGIPTTLSEFTNDTNFQNPTQVDSIISTKVTKEYIESLGVEEVATSNTSFNSLKLGNELPSYYLDYDNFTNTPLNVSEFTNDAGYQNETQVTSKIISEVDKTFIEDMNIDATSLAGRLADHYLDYEQLINKPFGGKTSLTIEDLTDVTMTNLQNGMVLKYNGTEWAPDFDIGTQPQTGGGNSSTDALTLQGYSPADFFEYDNLSGEPTKLSQFTNDVDFLSDSEIETKILDTVTPVYLSNMAVDAGTLDGEDSLFYLDYNNFTSTPQNVGDFINDKDYANSTFVTSITDTKANTVMLSSVAFSGSYTDILNTPQNVGDFINDKDYANTTQINDTIINTVTKNYVEAFNINAMTLDNADKSHLLNYDNFTNTPSIPNKLEDLSDVLVSGTPSINYILSWNGTGWIAAPSPVGDAQTLGNELPSYYLDYDNFTDTPQNVSEFTNDSFYANTEYVDTAVSNIVDSAPETLNTLNELASALGDDENFSTTLSNQIGTKANTSMLSVSALSGSYTDLIDTPQNVSEFTNDSDYQNSSDVSSIVTNTVDKNFIESFDINAKSLDHTIEIVSHTGDTILTNDSSDKIISEDSGIRSSDFYIDYNNFLNTPQNLTDFNNDLVTKTFIDTLNIDADTLDGQSGTYFLDYSNFMNEPDVSIFNNDADYANTIQVNTQITNTVTKEFVEDLGITGGGSGNFTGFSNTIQVGTPTVDYGQNLLEDGASVTLNSNTSVAEAIDILNETLLNIRNQTYVRDAKFTYSVTSDEAGHTGHLHSPVTISLVDDGDYTLSSPQHTWTFSTSGADQTRTGANPTFTWDEPNGGTFTIKHRIEASSGVQYPGSAGSWSEHTESVTITPPLPIPDFTADDVSIDIDGSGTLVTFTDNSLFSNMFMWDMGDGTVYPTGATENDPFGITSGVQWLQTTGITHTYTGTVDTQFTVKLFAFHTDHAQESSTHCILKQKTNYISGYVPLSPSFTTSQLEGNNQDSTDTSDNVEGHLVNFTNTTQGVGNFGQFFEWEFHNSSTNFIRKTNGTVSMNDTASSGSGHDGDYNVDISRYFSRDNLSVDATVSYEVVLEAHNGHTSSPFYSAAQTVVVKKDPRSIFSYGMKNNPTGYSTYDATHIGFNFTGYDGLDYNIVTFNDSSENSTTNYWDFDNSISGDITSSGWTTSTPGNSIDNQYTSPNTYSVKMIAYGNTSESLTDDTELKNNIIIINSAPTAPSNLNGKTISLPSSSGLNPAMCTGTTINTTETPPSPGDLIKRLEAVQVETTITDYANEFPSNGDNVGSASAVINGTTDGSKSFSATSSNLGQSGSLFIEEDVDSNSLTPSLYPLNFYRQFKARISKSNNPAGYNTYQITHSDGSSTNVVGWIQDNLTVPPTLANYAVNHLTDGSLRYVSGVPYYNTGGQVQIAGLQIQDITGQTYNKTEQFITVESDSGSVASTQTYNYTQALGTAIPSAGLKDVLTSINNLTVNISGSGVGVGTLKAKAINVEGESGWKPSSKQIKYWYSTPTFNENNMTAFNGTLKRVNLGLTGATPSYTAADFFNTAPWNSQTSLVGTDEAVMTPNGFEHDVTDYSTFLPVGPDYSSGRSGTQYVTVAFKEAYKNKFAITITGSVSEGYVAMPGHQDLDNSSGLNGWFKLDQETPLFGIVGTVTPPSGRSVSGVDGCIKAGSSVLQKNTNTTQTLQVALNASTSEQNTGSYQGAYTVPYTILIRFGLTSGQSITALSVSEGA